MSLRCGRSHLIVSLLWLSLAAFSPAVTAQAQGMPSYAANMAPMAPSMAPNGQMYFGDPNGALTGQAQMPAQMQQAAPMQAPYSMPPGTSAGMPPQASFPPNMPSGGMGRGPTSFPQGAPSSGPSFTGPPSVMEQALSLHQAGRYADAVHLYESIIYSTPPDPRLYASIADAHFRLGNNERALKYAVEALKLDPNYSSGHLLLGTILGEMGDYIRASRSYHKVLVLDQNNPYAYYNLGLLHYKQADVKAAIEYLEKARNLNPDDPKIWNNLGVAYYDQGMFPQALIAYSEALRLDPRYESAANNMELLQRSMPAPRRMEVSTAGPSSTKSSETKPATQSSLNLKKDSKPSNNTGAPPPAATPNKVTMKPSPEAKTNNNPSVNNPPPARPSRPTRP